MPPTSPTVAAAGDDVVYVDHVAGRTTEPLQAERVQMRQFGSRGDAELKLREHEVADGLAAGDEGAERTDGSGKERPRLSGHSSGIGPLAFNPRPAHATKCIALQDCCDEYRARKVKQRHAILIEVGAEDGTPLETDRRRRESVRDGKLTQTRYNKQQGE